MHEAIHSRPGGDRRSAAPRHPSRLKLSAASTQRALVEPDAALMCSTRRLVTLLVASSISPFREGLIGRGCEPSDPGRDHRRRIASSATVRPQIASTGQLLQMQAGETALHDEKLSSLEFSSIPSGSPPAAAGDSPQTPPASSTARGLLLDPAPSIPAGHPASRPAPGAMLRTPLAWWSALEHIRKMFRPQAPFLEARGRQRQSSRVQRPSRPAARLCGSTPAGPRSCRAVQRSGGPGRLLLSTQEGTSTPSSRPSSSPCSKSSCCLPRDDGPCPALAEPPARSGVSRRRRSGGWAPVRQRSRTSPPVG